MRLLRQIIALCLFVSSACAFSTAQAAASATAAEALNKDAVCTKCHDETENKAVLSIYQTRHGVKADSRTPTCQSCHGESDAHVKNAEGKATRPAVDILFGMKSSKNSSYARSEADVQNNSCMSCHSNAGGKRNHWTGSQHESRGVVCVACHEVHAKSDKVLAKTTQPEVCFTCHKTQRAETHKFSVHPVDAAKMSCSNCHNPHGSAGPKLLVKNTVNETCYSCHQDKRGPFLWEHQPANEDCTNCHTPHGSSTTPLLKAKLPFLCQQCHQDHGGPLRSDISIPTSAGNPPAGAATARGTAKLLGVQGNGRMCVNCHVMVHGSNHPSGFVLNR